jgi:hypothetical protein
VSSGRNAAMTTDRSSPLLRSERIAAHNPIGLLRARRSSMPCPAYTSQRKREAAGTGGRLGAWTSSMRRSDARGLKEVRP